MGALRPSSLVQDLTFTTQETWFLAEHRIPLFLPKLALIRHFVANESPVKHLFAAIPALNAWAGCTGGAHEDLHWISTLDRNRRKTVHKIMNCLGAEGINDPVLVQRTMGDTVPER